MTPVRVGSPVSEIDTPALVIDLDAMRRNLSRMAQFAATHGVRWRPHAKMHKCAALALLQIEAGAVGVCVQKTAEAEAMVAGGVYDIYISNEVIAPSKLERVAALAQRCSAAGGRLAIAVDHAEGVRRLALAMQAERSRTGSETTIDVFVEIDVGQGRCGVLPGPAAAALALAIAGEPGLCFAGLQAYNGAAQHFRKVNERRDAIAAAVAAVTTTTRLIESNGLKVALVTGAGSGTMLNEATSGVYGELQAGSFLFMDADYGQNIPDPHQPDFEHALFVKTQVMSAGSTHVVCDAGHKSHAIESGLPRVHCLDDAEPPLVYANGGDEHGVLRPRDAGDPLPSLGDIVWLIPGHCDPTVNLHDTLVGVSGGLREGVVERVFRVDARGAVR